MVIDHKEIEAMKAAGPQTGGTSSTGVASAPRGSSEVPASAPTAADRRSMPQAPTASQLERILRIQVPVIVQLCTRKMPISRLRRLSVGTIVEFERPVEAPLELLVNNRPIATGQAVRVGEHFGLRINVILDRAERIRSLGQ